MLFDLTGWDQAALLAKLLVYGGSFMAVGAILFLIANARFVNNQRRLLVWLVFGSASIAVFGSLLQFAVQAGRLLDEGIAGMVDPEMLALVSETPLGTAVAVRCIGLVLLLAGALRSRIGSVISITGTLLVAVSFALVGHGTGEPRWLLTSLIALHVLGISYWIGALWPIHRSVADGASLQLGGELAHRFGQQAIWIVGALVLAGGILAYLIAGSLAALVTSQYGLTLLAKHIFVAALLALAAANKLRFVPAVQAGDLAAARHLRRSIGWEALAVLIILLITAILTTVTPLPTTMGVDNG